MTTPTPPAAFFADGDDLVPTALAAGPWGQSLSGNIVGSVLAHAIERDEGGDPDLQPARLTVDLPRPVLLEPLRIRTSVLREGRRLKLVDAEVLQSGAVVATATALANPGFMPPARQPALG